MSGSPKLMFLLQDYPRGQNGEDNDRMFLSEDLDLIERKINNWFGDEADIDENEETIIENALRVFRRIRASAQGFIPGWYFIGRTADETKDLFCLTVLGVCTELDHDADNPYSFD